jgi:hypothetical protein
MVWRWWWLRRHLRLPFLIACLPVLVVADRVYWLLLFDTAAGRRVDALQRWWQRRGWPRTADEAVARLYRRLSPRERRMLAAPDDAIDWFGFGLGVRDEFGLWAGNDALIASCQIGGGIGPAADLASGVILHRLVLLCRQRHAEPGAAADGGA